MAIAPNMFGIDPMSYQQQQNKQDFNQAVQYASLDPFQRATASMYQGATQLGRSAQGMLGMEDPQITASKEAQSLMGQFDPTTSEGLKGLSLALMQRAQATNSPVLAGLAQQAAAQYQKAILNEATVEQKMREKIPAAEEEAKRVRLEELVTKYGKQEGAMRFWQEIQESKEKVAKAGVAPAVKAAGNISGVVSAYQGTVKPYTETIDAAETTVSLINEAQKTSNPTAYEGARVQLARAVGNSSLSRRDIEAAGGDPSIAGKITNTTSELFTGIPTEATLKDIARAANIVKKAAQMKKDKITMQQRDIAKSEFNMDDAALERQFPMSGKTTSGSQGVKTLDWNTYATPKKP